MTDLQEKELEILKYFIQVCDKLNLTYYLVCGSALGAVKYGGFIPWDDDIDVAMPREDYKVFCNKAQSYLPEHIFVQTYNTDTEFPQIFCKLRDSDTTYIEKTAWKLNINHGIFIDVFPLDGYPRGHIRSTIFDMKKRLYQSALLSAYEINRKGKSYIFYRVLVFLGINRKTARTARRYEKMLCRYKIKDSLVIANHGNWQGKLEYAPSWHYGVGAWAEFEGVKVRIPEKYNEYLKQKYGEWQLELSDEEKKGHHHYKVYDLYKPYTKYVCNKK